MGWLYLFACTAFDSHRNLLRRVVISFPLYRIKQVGRLWGRWNRVWAYGPAPVLQGSGPH